MRQIAKDSRNAQDIIGIIEAYAIEQHKDCIEFIHFMELEKIKDVPDNKRAMLYKRIGLAANDREKTACTILDRIAGLPDNMSHYVSWDNKIEIMDLTEPA